MCLARFSVRSVIVARTIDRYQSDKNLMVTHSHTLAGQAQVDALARTAERQALRMITIQGSR